MTQNSANTGEGVVLKTGGSLEAKECPWGEQVASVALCTQAFWVRTKHGLLAPKHGGLGVASRQSVLPEGCQQ